MNQFIFLRVISRDGHGLVMLQKDSPVLTSFSCDSYLSGFIVPTLLQCFYIRELLFFQWNSNRADKLENLGSLNRQPYDFRMITITISTLNPQLSLPNPSQFFSCTFVRTLPARSSCTILYHPISILVLSALHQIYYLSKDSRIAM